MSDSNSPNDFALYVRENYQLITRLLAYDDAEARWYALANSATVKDIEVVQEQSKKLMEACE